MGMVKPQDYVPSDYCEPGFSEPEKTKPGSAEQMELDLLLEELAEFIEPEDGILIPSVAGGTISWGYIQVC